MAAGDQVEVPNGAVYLCRQSLALIGTCLPEKVFHVHVADFTKKIKSAQGIFIFLVVYPVDKHMDDAGMTREELRRENARKLASGKGGKADFARLVSMEPSQVSQLIGPNPSKNIGNSIARRIERAYELPEGWIDLPHPELRIRDDQEDSVVGEAAPGASTLRAETNRTDDGFIVDVGSPLAGGQRVRAAGGPETVSIRAVKLRLQAGVNGFVEELDMDIDHGHFPVPQHVIEKLGTDPSALMIMKIKGRSMEPMYFEDDIVLVDTTRKIPKNNECFAVNWNGELLIKSLIKKSAGWAHYSFNRDYPTVSVRSGLCSIIGMVVWQPDRIVMGRL
jgi:hypothetical protein